MTRPLLASAAVYLAFTAAIGRDVIARLSTGILSDRFDPVLNTGILVWNATHLPWTDAWFNFPGFHPATGALTFSEHLLGASVVFTPLYWLTGDAIVAYNLTALATFVLCGMAMFALVWKLTHSGVASFVAGFAFAFAPYKVSQIAHLQALATFWAPLALLGLHGFISAPGSAIGTRSRWLALFAVAWVMQGAANGYLLVFFSVLVALWVLWFVVAHGRWRELLWIAGAGVAAVVPLAPILLRFRSVHEAHGFVRPLEEVVGFSADISSIGCAAPGLSVWGWLARGVCGGERELFPGLTVMALVVLAGLASRRVSAKRRMWPTVASAVLIAGALVMCASALGVAVVGPWRWELGPLSISSSSVARDFGRGLVLLLLGLACSPALWAAVRAASVPAFYLLAAAVMWTLSWGPVPQLVGQSALSEGPYAWLQLLPGVDSLRVPARFWMMTVLCLSVATGALLAAALRDRSRAMAGLVAAAAVLSLAVDGWTTFPAADLLARPPAPALLQGGVALTLPLGAATDQDAAAQRDAAEGGWRSINGYSGYEPAHYAALREASENADPAILSAFVVTSDLQVVVDESVMPLLLMVERFPGARLVGQASGLRQFRIPRQGEAEIAVVRGVRAVIAAVSASCSDDYVRLAIDGDPASRWDCGPQRAGQTLITELGAEGDVGQVVLVLGPYGRDYPRRLAIDTSLDGEAWIEARSGSVVEPALTALTMAPREGRIVLSFAPRRARYLRLRLLSDDDVYYWSVGELEVWSGGAPIPGASTGSR
jgi:hypothetical protein